MSEITVREDHYTQTTREVVGKIEIHGDGRETLRRTIIVRVVSRISNRGTGLWSEPALQIFDEYGQSTPMTFGVWQHARLVADECWAKWKEAYGDAR